MKEQYPLLSITTS